MKRLFFLLIFFLPALFSFGQEPVNLPSTISTADLSSEDCDDVEIVDISITFNSDCETYVWAVVICNNNNYCTTDSGSLNVDVEFCPFQYQHLSRSYGSLAPHTCTVISGTGNGCLGACLRVEIEGITNEIMICSSEEC